MGKDFERTLQSGSTVEANYNLNFSGASTAFQVSFFEIVDSEMGYLPLTRIAAGFRYYPVGLNGGKIILDNGARGRLWRASPFGSVNFGFTNISIRDPVGSFNAFILDALVKVGVEIPVATDWVLLGQFGYLMSVLGSDETDIEKSIDYGGIIVLGGLRLTSF